ncbi:hypothetical protein P4519_12590, partial [Geobacillus stearothermophilus]|uniref:hypothetical protein n=1 Tax=Geobacillus stearothermophilus TaxID=1422 RepID=UPI002E22DC6F|nr:hypothetical protein [Geobacillus stearothermophilus]
KISTKLKKDVRDFVEKYFLDTPEGPKSLDKSTFLEGGFISFSNMKVVQGIIKKRDVWIIYP